MKTQSNELIELAQKNRWEATELDNYDYRERSVETWRLESIWTPAGVRVLFFIFN
jgi:hypothetical protein